MDLFSKTAKEIMELIDAPAPSLKRLNWHDESQTFNSLLIVPRGDLHDSGWMCMVFIALLNNELVGYFDCGSDVISLDGCGGYGLYSEWENGIPYMVAPKGWRMDMTPGGILRLFTMNANYNLKAEGLSDFNVYAIKREK